MVAVEDICELLFETEPNWSMIKHDLAKVHNLRRKKWGPVHPSSEGIQKTLKKNFCSFLKNIRRLSMKYANRRLDLSVKNICSVFNNIVKVGLPKEKNMCFSN